MTGPLNFLLTQNHYLLTQLLKLDICLYPPMPVHKLCWCVQFSSLSVLHLWAPYRIIKVSWLSVLVNVNFCFPKDTSKVNTCEHFLIQGSLLLCSRWPVSRVLSAVSFDISTFFWPWFLSLIRLCLVTSPDQWPLSLLPHLPIVPLVSFGFICVPVFLPPVTSHIIYR